MPRISRSSRFCRRLAATNRRVAIVRRPFGIWLLPGRGDRFSVGQAAGATGENESRGRSWLAVGGRHARGWQDLSSAGDGPVPGGDRSAALAQWAWRRHDPLLGCKPLGMLLAAVHPEPFDPRTESSLLKRSRLARKPRSGPRRRARYTCESTIRRPNWPTTPARSKCRFAKTSCGGRDSAA